MQEENDLSGKGRGFKITFPEKLGKDLSDFANAKGITKSEAVKLALEDFLQHEETWKKRGYFFKQREPKKNTAELLNDLSSAPKGSSVFVAVSYVDNPHEAEIWTCDLIKVDKQTIYVSFRNEAFRSYSEKQNIALTDGALVIPEEQPSNSHFFSTFNYIYALNVAYIWDVENSIMPARRL
jgi:hypothetical protein